MLKSKSNCDKCKKRLDKYCCIEVDGAKCCDHGMSVSGILIIKNSTHSDYYQVILSTVIFLIRHGVNFLSYF